MLFLPTQVQRKEQETRSPSPVLSEKVTGHVTYPLRLKIKPQFQSAR